MIADRCPGRAQFVALALPPNQRYKVRLGKATVFSLIVTLAWLSCLIMVSSTSRRSYHWRS